MVRIFVFGIVIFMLGYVGSVVLYPRFPWLPRLPRLPRLRGLSKIRARVYRATRGNREYDLDTEPLLMDGRDP